MDKQGSLGLLQLGVARGLESLRKRAVWTQITGAAVGAQQ